MKTCSKCKQDFPLTEYSFKVKSRGTYQSQCHSCRRESAKESYQKNKQGVKAKVAERTKVKREWYQRFKLTLSCCVCGESDPACLDFHHIDPSEKDIKPSQGVFQLGRAAALNEISKYACLCSNCHRKEHAGRLNASLVKVDITRASEA